MTRAPPSCRFVRSAAVCPWADRLRLLRPDWGAIRLRGCGYCGLRRNTPAKLRLLRLAPQYACAASAFSPHAGRNTPARLRLFRPMRGAMRLRPASRDALRHAKLSFCAPDIRSIRMCRCGAPKSCDFWQKIGQNGQIDAHRAAIPRLRPEARRNLAQSFARRAIYLP